MYKYFSQSTFKLKIKSSYILLYPRVPNSTTYVTINCAYSCPKISRYQNASMYVGVVAVVVKDMTFNVFTVTSLLQSCKITDLPPSTHRIGILASSPICPKKVGFAPLSNKRQGKVGRVLASFSRPKIRQNVNGKWLRGWPLDPAGGTTGRQCGSSAKQDHSCSAAHGAATDRGRGSTGRPETGGRLERHRRVLTRYFVGRSRLCQLQ